MTFTSWMILAFALAAGGELSRELGARTPTRATLFTLSIALMLIALADEQGVF